MGNREDRLKALGGKVIAPQRVGFTAPINRSPPVPNHGTRPRSESAPGPLERRTPR